MKKNKNYRLNISKEFVKTFLIIFVLGGIIWGWQHWKSSSKHRSIKKQDSKNEAGSASDIFEDPQTPSFQSLTALFPKEAWLDDYFQVKVKSSPSENKLIVSIGTAPSGKNPEEIKNREILHPKLLLIKKNENGFSKLDEFDFATKEQTDAGIEGNSLRGLPRITKNSLIDLDQDGYPELAVLLDTPGKWTEAVAFLKIQNGKLNWIKTKNSRGNQKIALWLTGSTATEAQEIIPKKTKGGAILILQKSGKFDPTHPEKGFKWKTIAWEYKDGMLREK